MSADWRLLSSKILDSLESCNLKREELLIMRDLIISHRRRHIEAEPQWSTLSEIPLAGGGNFELVSSSTRTSFRDKIREVSGLGKYLTLFGVSLFMSNPKGTGALKSSTLFFSDGFSDASRELFDEFIHEERFQTILGESTLIIQDRNVWRIKRIGDSIYVKDIGLYFALNIFNRRERIMLFIEFLRQIIGSNRLKRFGYIGLRKILLERTLWSRVLPQTEKMNLIATNSFVEILPTPFYFSPVAKGRRYLMWYSNNNFPAPSQKNSFTGDSNLDFACRGDVDVHLVWTSDFADTIRSQNSLVEVQVVGSLMMYAKRTIEPLQGFFKIVLFDMTPWEGYPPMMYGSELFMMSFVEDIVDVSQDFSDIRIYLKPKRRYLRSGNRRIHSKKYLALIDEYVTQGKLKLIDPRTNVYGLCSEADLILGFPFASPVIIGNELLKPSFYYNPDFSKDWPIRQAMDLVSVISGKENLRLKTQEIYNLKNS